MIIILSPSKTLDLTSELPTHEHTYPDFLAESQILIKELRTYPPHKLSALMDISDKLATLNAQRYQDFTTPFTTKNARPALLTFKGDVYTGIDVNHYSKADFSFAQNHIRILSGLYGLLRPLDLIQPYRLEMGTTLKNPRGNDLYAFWNERITSALNATFATQKHKLLINLASDEYFKAIQPKKLHGPLLNIVFKEYKNGTHKIIGLFAKRARGNMANFIIKNRLKTPEDLKKFDVDGYAFTPTLSNDTHYIFTR